MKSVQLTARLWEDLTNHYYDIRIQEDRDINIWEWLRQDYGADGADAFLALDRDRGTVGWLRFEDEKDHTLFLLRWS